MRLFLTESFPLCRNTSRIACWRNWRRIVSFDFDRYSVLLSPNQTVSVYFSLMQEAQNACNYSVLSAKWVAAD